MRSTLIDVAYLTASILFILGLKGLTHPRTARRGNLLGAVAMLLAVAVTLFDRQVITLEYIAYGVATGIFLGCILALRIQMTAMPELVALFNGFGGGASVMVAGAALLEGNSAGHAPLLQLLVAASASGVIGAVTFSGSIIAFIKLREWIQKAPKFPGQQFVNVLFAITCFTAATLVVIEPTHTDHFWITVGLAAALGLLLVLPIGGADMPVVIAFLNSCSGLAATATGFALDNSILIIAGSLVGASGLILTQIMCRAMNRTLGNVIFGGVGTDSTEGATDDEVYAGKVKSTSAEEIAMLFDIARRVVVVPGYGMAVAQAQHAVRDLATELEARGVEVEYAIHPVAGRMPGHMNVLLAEAEVPYDKLKEMDRINPSFERTDLSLVIGANDVVNPAARNDATSPIAGMPILDVDKSRTVVIIKRSLSPGFAGIPNPLFAADNTLMFFGNAREAVLSLVTAIKEN